MLRLVEELDAIAGVLILTELGLIFNSVELGVIVPSFAFEDID
jgi:hypothetical protein